MKLNAVIVTTIALVMVSAAIGGLLYTQLPDVIPTHFDVDGRPDGFTAKAFAVFTTPAVLALMGLLLSLGPRISPKRYRIDPFLRTYAIIAIAFLTVEFADGMMRLRSALGSPLNGGRLVSVGTGLLLLVAGNFLGKVTRNFFVGIRTPWTLANPEVWLRTHRLGGVLFVLGGATILIAGFTGTARAPFVVLPVVLSIALFLIGYSYVVYRRIESSKQP